MEKGKGEGQVGRHILHEKLGAGIQAEGQAYSKKGQRQHCVIPRQDPPRPPAVKSPDFRHWPAPEHRSRIGQIQQEGAHQHRAVHPDVPAAQQIIQGIAADDRRPPALLPDVVPADHENHQDPQSVQLRDPSFFPVHASAVLSFSGCFRLRFRVPLIPVYSVRTSVLSSASGSPSAALSFSCFFRPLIPVYSVRASVFSSGSGSAPVCSSSAVCFSISFSICRAL